MSVFVHNVFITIFRKNGLFHSAAKIGFFNNGYIVFCEELPKFL
jgi:hypothetical protein